MPEPIPMIVALGLTEHTTELVIKIKGGSRETRIAEFDAETAAKWIPAETPGETYQTCRSVYLQGLAAKRET